MSQLALKRMFDTKGWFNKRGKPVMVYQCKKCERYFSTKKSDIDKTLYCRRCRK